VANGRGRKKGMMERGGAGWERKAVTPGGLFFLARETSKKKRSYSAGPPKKRETGQGKRGKLQKLRRGANGDGELKVKRLLVGEIRKRKTLGTGKVRGERKDGLVRD